MFNLGFISLLYLEQDTGFPLTERDRLGLRGLLPPRIISFEQQYDRFMESYRSLEKHTLGAPPNEVSLAKWRILNRLHDRNETLYYRVSIEEAEAQCVLLNSESLCDGCFTADSDVFLFGAKTIYRDIDLGDGGHVVCYEMVDIERKLGLGRNSLITLALLLGSDYSHGVHGFGPETACQIVRSFGDHNVLQQVASEGFAFVKKTKGLKKQGEVRNCYANKENSDEKDMQKDHQFIKVIDAYLKPKCHSPDSETVHRVLVHHPFRRSELQKLCSQFSGWPSEKTDEYILPKISERDLPFCGQHHQNSESSFHCKRIVQGSKCFEVAWKEYGGLKSSVVPADLIECACPEKIVEFEEKTLGKKKNLKPKTKKPQKTAAMDDIDQKLKGLLLDIESENNAVSGSTQCRGAHTQLPIGKALPEVIDILSPSPCQTSKLQNTNDPLVDVIYVSESETDTSPEYARKARELRCAVVTGGNKGIGLASNGILVILTARDEKRGVEAVENLNKQVDASGKELGQPSAAGKQQSNVKKGNQGYKAYPPSKAAAHGLLFVLGDELQENIEVQMKECLSVEYKNVFRANA
ncbi:hypothetical protein IFM89_001184 [Coptis chinensis]|uniref:XPG-I domain-containing protein n=1 Tax=Coptis chinensis TaxID=261450 RepID=A0A835MC89_9MAGN|nr:hypothetical protein IFM89_001184 [Coptis chinensis]